MSFIINPFEIYDAEFSTTASYNYLYMNMEKTDIEKYNNFLVSYFESENGMLKKTQEEFFRSFRNG